MNREGGPIPFRTCFLLFSPYSNPAGSVLSDPILQMRRLRLPKKKLRKKGRARIQDHRVLSPLGLEEGRADSLQCLRVAS
jgi:hypothetical protein